MSWQHKQHLQFFLDFGIRSLVGWTLGFGLADRVRHMGDFSVRQVRSGTWQWMWDTGLPIHRQCQLCSFPVQYYLCHLLLASPPELLLCASLLIGQEIGVFRAVCVSRVLYLYLKVYRICETLDWRQKQNDKPGIQDSYFFVQSSHLLTGRWGEFLDRPLLTVMNICSNFFSLKNNLNHYFLFNNWMTLLWKWLKCWRLLSWNCFCPVPSKSS